MPRLIFNSVRLRNNLLLHNTKYRKIVKLKIANLHLVWCPFLLSVNFLLRSVSLNSALIVPQASGKPYQVHRRPASTESKKPYLLKCILPC
jgi:hypothetical protein